jgi:hypothetical protein
MQLLEGDVGAEWFAKTRRKELDLLSFRQGEIAA